MNAKEYEQKCSKGNCYSIECNIYLTVFQKTCLQLTLRQSQWLGEYPLCKHVTGTSPAGWHVNTQHSSKLKELNKHSQ